MKILVISYLFPNSRMPDTGIFVLNRLKSLGKMCDIKVINPIPWFPFSFLFTKYRQFSKVPKKEIIHGIEVHHPRFFIIPRFFKFIDAFTFACSVLPLTYKLKKSFNFDIVDLHWTYPDLLAGRLISLLSGKKQLVTIRGKEALYLEEASLRSWIISTCLKQCYQVVTLSDELGADVKKLGVKKTKVKTIRNGVDLDAFYLMDKDRCRDRLTLDRNHYVVLSIGSLIFRKGHDRAIKAFKQVVAVRPDARLYIIGAQGPEGDYRTVLNQLVIQLGLGEQVIFIGHVSNLELVHWYNAADLFCLLSRGEGSPNVLTEALACGCPSIATDVGAVPEILCHGFMGALVPNQAEAIALSMKQIAGRGFNRKQIAGYMKAYDWDWCARQVFDLYKKTLDK